MYVCVRVCVCACACGRCDLLTITAFDGDPTTLNERMRTRRGVAVSARVHPGETNASWYAWQAGVGAGVGV
jgi:hypothetical protein